MLFRKNRVAFRERRREGIAPTKQRGAYRGRKKTCPTSRPSYVGNEPLPASRKPSWPMSSVISRETFASTYARITDTCPSLDTLGH